MRSLPRIQKCARLSSFHVLGRHFLYLRVVVGIPLSRPVHVVETHHSVVACVQRPAVAGDPHEVVEGGVLFTTVFSDVESQIEVRQRIGNVGRYFVLDRHDAPVGSFSALRAIVLASVQLDKEIRRGMTQRRLGRSRRLSASTTSTNHLPFPSSRLIGCRGLSVEEAIQTSLQFDHSGLLRLVAELSDGHAVHAVLRLRSLFHLGENLLTTDAVFLRGRNQLVRSIVHVEEEEE